MQVTIYSTTTCSACHALTAWLEKINVKYDKKITDEDEAAMMEFMSLNDGMIGVPFTVVTDDAGIQTKISGYDQPKFKKALGL
jgi:glutaredoxin